MIDLDESTGHLISDSTPIALNLERVVAARDEALISVSLLMLTRDVETQLDGYGVACNLDFGPGQRQKLWIHTRELHAQRKSAMEEYEDVISHLSSGKYQLKYHPTRDPELVLL